MEAPVVAVVDPRFGRRQRFAMGLQVMVADNRREDQVDGVGLLGNCCARVCALWLGGDWHHLRVL